MITASFVSRAQATEQKSGPPLLFGGAVQPRKPPIRLDPVLPRGEPRLLDPPTRASDRLCSLARPVCVDAVFGELGLGALVLAYEEHIYGLSLPGPTASFEEPLTFSRALGRDLQASASLLPSRGFDRGEAACSSAVLSLSHARRCVAEAALLGRAPAGASWLRRGHAAHLAAELGAAPEVYEAQLRSSLEPQVGVLSSTVAYEDPRTGQLSFVSPLRSARFFAFLDAGSQAPLAHAGYLALLLSATQTPAGAPRFEAEPDLMDVIAATLEGDSSAIARFVDDFASYSYHNPVAPLQLPPRLEGQIEGRIDWSIEGKTLPRSLILPRPIEPTGSSYVRLDLTTKQKQQLIAMQTHCESPVSYVWSVLRLDSKGNRVGAVPIGYKERGTSVEVRIEPMEGVASLVFVGTNMGGVDMTHPFDPDHQPHEAHGCRLYLSVLEPAEPEVPD